MDLAGCRCYANGHEQAALHKARDRLPGLVLVRSGGRAQASELPYAKLQTMQAAFLALPRPERDRLEFATLVTRSDKANHAPIRMWVEANGTRTERSPFPRRL